ncbi:hypothetical protein B0H16DRAFT_1883942 [Mycena metata]|uniref:MFS general substrate transporter n=1 Tax=Mycena metata TaxID=1033252 RepID=A0AAD7NJ12_9AGAR|nr:hypothetical protein B0H16DRAFT_1883942 [Mycena metata]
MRNYHHFPQLGRYRCHRARCQCLEDYEDVSYPVELELCLKSSRNRLDCYKPRRNIAHHNYKILRDLRFIEKDAASSQSASMKHTAPTGGKPAPPKGLHSVAEPQAVEAILRVHAKAHTLAVAFGIIGDVATRAERGGYVGMASLGAMVGPAIGPILGGVLADKLGSSSSIFFSAVCTFVMILFLPETLRALVGNGSIPVSAIYRRLIPILGRRTKQSPATSNIGVARKKFRNPLLLLLHVNIAFFWLSMEWCEHLNVGLCFLNMLAAESLSLHSCGWWADDWDYQRVLRSLRAQNPTHEQGDDNKVVVDDAFPIEKARMRLMPAFLAVFVACWCTDKRTNIAGPLILLIGVRLVVIGVMNSTLTRRYRCVGGPADVSRRTHRTALSGAPDTHRRDTEGTAAGERGGGGPDVVVSRKRTYHPVQ